MTTVSGYRRGSAGRLLICIHDSSTFLSDLDGLLDPPCCPVRLTADDSRLVTVDDVILCVYVICDQCSVIGEARNSSSRRADIR